MSEHGETLDAEIDRIVQTACSKINHKPGIDCRDCYIRGLVRRLVARIATRENKLIERSFKEPGRAPGVSGFIGSHDLMNFLL
jgi:hypothetical protein